jgi:6-methylsalicylate decarboxylase
VIDVHVHDVPDFYRRAVAEAGRGPAISSGLPQWSPQLALETMDRLGISTAITSITAPGVHFGDDVAARTLARRCNEFKASCIERWPARFGGFAVLPLPDLSGTLAEIEYALDELRLDGVCLYTSYEERYLGDASLDPVFDVLNEREAVAFVHPIANGAVRGVQLDLPFFMLEYVFETTRAATNLIYSGALDRFPKIRFILAHAGGTLPFLTFRIAHSPLIDPKRLAGMTPAGATERIGRFYYDTALSPGAEVFGALRAVAMPERILFGSDWPFAPEAVGAAAIARLGTPGLLSAEERSAIERRNAARLFPRYSGGLAEPYKKNSRVARKSVVQPSR